MKVKTKPVFNVIVHDTNKGSIERVNFFELPAWGEIKYTLRKVKRRKGFNLETAEYILNGECMYHFWAKAEWEVVVKEWIGKPAELKIDVYYQLKANWELFKTIALKSAGIIKE